MQTQEVVRFVKNYVVDQSFHAVGDRVKFATGFQGILNSLAQPVGIYCGDNLFTYHKNLSFLDDEKFVASFMAHSRTDIEKSLMWRSAVVLWAARNGLRLQGDFVECASNQGVSARVICDAVDFSRLSDRHYALYDHSEKAPSEAGAGDAARSKAQEIMAPFSNASVVQGRVPDVLAEAAPRSIAFLHLGLHNAEAELGAMKILFERMVPGAVMVLDGYGWIPYREQKQAEDAWLAEQGYAVLELPTGQGIVIR